MAIRVGESIEAADWLHLDEDEEVQWVGRPSRFTIGTRLAGAVILVVVGVLLTVWLAPSVAANGLPSFVGYTPLLLTLAGVVVAAYTYLGWLRLLYVVTDRELYVKVGLVSRDVTQVRLDRVQNTTYDQTVLERIFSYGDVTVYTAGSSTEDLVLRSVPRPDRVAGILTQLLSERARSERFGSDGV